MLKDISFYLKPGEVLGRAWAHRLGKTTLTRLLFRLYDPQKGQVRLDGVDLRDTQLASIGKTWAWSRRVSISSTPACGTILPFLIQTIPDEHIIAVLQELGMDDWLKLMPEGLEQS